MVIFDTNIIIDHLRQSPEKSKLLSLFKKYNEEKFSMSIVSLQELYEGQSTKKHDVHEKLLNTLANLEILPYTFEVAKLAGEIARDIGRPIGFGDAAIAATAVLNDSKLATINAKDFKGIKGLELL